ncbi:MAG: YfcC family protein [Firmicutes bacterium]|nr:YfcC family protein [Bacillota bacterium]
MSKFKMPSAYTILFLIIIVVAILTWIVPAGTYEYVDPEASALEPVPGTYSRTEQNPQGFWEILGAPIAGFFDAVDIILFILVIGGFLAVVTETGAIDAGIGSIVRRFKGRETVMIPILMILFGLGGTIFGMAEETIAFYILIIPIFIAAGFDAMTGMAVVFVGAGIGCLGSTVNPFATGIASGFAGISIGEGIVLRLIILAATMTVGILYVMRYANKVRKHPELSVVAEMREDNIEFFLGSKGEGEAPEDASDKMSGRQKAVLALFGICFLVMILGVIPWASKFNIFIFENLNSWLLGLPVVGTVLGNITPLGDWWFSDITVLFLLGSILCAFIYRWNETRFIEIFLNGAKDLLGVAIIIGITRGIAVVMNNGGMTATILNLGEEGLRSLASGAFAVISFVFFALLSFLVPSTSGLAALSMPIMAPIADFVGIGRDLVITAYATASGIVNLVTPTSGVLMGALAIGRISYGAFIKFIWKLLLILIAIVVTALIASAVLA